MIIHYLKVLLVITKPSIILVSKSIARQVKPTYGFWIVDLLTKQIGRCGDFATEIMSLSHQRTIIYKKPTY